MSYGSRAGCKCQTHSLLSSAILNWASSNTYSVNILKNTSLFPVYAPQSNALPAKEEEEERGTFYRLQGEPRNEAI